MPYYMILNCVISYYIILEYYVKLYFTYIYIILYIYVNQLGDYNRTIPEEPQHREAGDLAEVPIKT